MPHWSSADHLPSDGARSADVPTRVGLVDADGEAVHRHEPTRRYGSAVRWAYVNQIGRQVTNLVISLVLAALLGPRAFGVVALATVFLAVFELVIEQSAGHAIIQRQEVEASHLDAAFWFVLGTSALLGIIAAVTAPLWAAAADLPELTSVIRVLALTMPLSALAIIQVAILKRRMDFRAITIREQVAMIIAGIVGIGAALAGAGMWALVIQAITLSVVDVAVLWTISPWRPRWRFSFRHARELAGFSTGSMLNGLGAFLNTRVEVILIGFVLGPVAVSIYRLASRIVNVVVDIAIGALGQVALPTLSPLHDDPVGFRNATVRMLRHGSLVSVALLALVGAGSLPLTMVLGDEWSDAHPTMPVLALAAAFTSMSALITPTLMSAGRTRAAAVRSWTITLVNAGLLWTASSVVAGRGLQTELLGLAGTRLLLGAALWAGADAALFRRVAHVPLATYYGTGVRRLAVGVAAALSGWAVAAAIGGDGWSAGIAAGSVAVAVLVGGLTITDGEVRRVLGASWQQRSWRRPAVES